MIFSFLYFNSHLSWANDQCSYRFLHGSDHPSSFTLHHFPVPSAATLTFVLLLEHTMGSLPQHGVTAMLFLLPFFHLINCRLPLKIKLKCCFLRGTISDPPSIVGQICFLSALKVSFFLGTYLSLQSYIGMIAKIISVTGVYLITVPA